MDYALLRAEVVRRFVKPALPNSKDCGKQYFAQKVRKKWVRKCKKNGSGNAKKMGPKMGPEMQTMGPDSFFLHFFCIFFAFSLGFCWFWPPGPNFRTRAHFFAFPDPIGSGGPKPAKP